MKRLLVLFACAGCVSERTEMIVDVRASDVTPGVDFHFVRITVSDPMSTFTGFDKNVLVCRAPREPAQCRGMPLSVTLFPGDGHPDDSVVVKVSTDSGLVDSAQFGFARGVSARLDFVLYRVCLTTDCSMTPGTACAPNGRCEPLYPLWPYDLAPPHDFSGGNDFATAPGTDMAAPPGSDLSTAPGADLSPLPGADLAPPPPDLTPPTCGNVGQPCCQSPLPAGPPPPASAASPNANGPWTCTAPATCCMAPSCTSSAGRTVPFHSCY